MIQRNGQAEKPEELLRSVKIFANGKVQKCKMVIDTGAQTNCWPIKLAKDLDLKIKGTANELNVRGAFDPEGESISTKGVVTVQIMAGSTLHEVEFRVVPSGSFDDVLLGWPTIKRLGLIIEKGTVFSKDRTLFGEVIPTKINWLKYNIYKVVANRRETILTAPGVLSLVKGSVVVESAQKPKIIADEEVTKYMVPIPKIEKPADIPMREDFKNHFCKINPDLTGRTLERVLNICERYRKVFTMSSEVIGSVPAKDFQFKQDFLSSPVPFRQYKQSPEKEQFVHKEIVKLHRMGVLEETDKYIVTAQLHCVAKKDGTDGPEEPRIVCDLRGSNLAVEASNLKLNDMQDILADLNGSVCFISCDLTKAYWSIKTHPDDVAFYTVQDPVTLRVYQFQVLPMGAKNASVLFQLFIQSQVLRELEVNSYIDDLFIGAPGINAALELFEKLLQRLDRFHLKLSLKKVSSMLNGHTTAFGYNIDQTGVKPNDYRIQDLLNIRMPSTKKAMLSALCQFNYFRDHLFNFSGVSNPLYKITGKKAEFVIRKEHVIAWNQIKGLLAEAIKIRKLLPKVPVVLQCDASHVGQAAILYQEVNNQKHIVGIFSKSLPPSCAHWHINHLELKNIADSLKKFDKFIGFQHVNIVTDSSYTYYALKTLLMNTQMSTRVPALRALSYIATFNYTVHLIKGDDPDFGMTDFLSRCHSQETILCKNSKMPLFEFGARKVQVVRTENKPEDKVEQTLRMKALMPLPSLQSVHEIVKTSQTESKECKEILMASDEVNKERNYIIENSTVYKNTPYGRALYVPRYYVSEVLQLVHRHEPAAKLLQTVRAYELYFTQMVMKTINFVSQCPCDGARACHQDKSYSKKVNNPQRPLDIVAIDLAYVNKVPVLVIIDHFSKYSVLKSLQNETAVEIKRGLVEYFCHFGVPMRILCDNGKNLNEASILNLYRALGICVSNSSPYCSQANSVCERFIQTAQNRLRSQHEFSPDLDLQLQIINFQLNCTPSKNSVLSPFQKMFGRSSVWSLNNPYLRIAKNRLESLKMNKDYDLYETYEKIQKIILDERDKRRAKYEHIKTKIKKNDIVRIKNRKPESKKLFNPFSREVYKVTGVNHNVCHLLEITTKDRHPNVRVSHARFLKLVKELPEEVIAQDQGDFDPIIERKDDPPEIVGNAQTENNSSHQEVVNPLKAPASRPLPKPSNYNLRPRNRQSQRLQF